MLSVLGVRQILVFALILGMAVAGIAFAQAPAPGDAPTPAAPAPDAPAPTSAPAAPSVAAAGTGFDEVYKAICTARPTLTTEVRGLTLTRDAASFTFSSGRFEIFEPVRGRYHAVAFRGEGKFRIEPPTPIEKAQLKKFTDHEILEEPFTSLVLRFTDDTVPEIERSLKLETFPPGLNSEGQSLLDGERKDAFKKELFNVDSRILMDVVSNAKGFFLAKIDSKDHGDFIYVIDPLEREEVTLYQNKETFTEFTDNWSSFHLKDQYDGTEPVRDRSTDLIAIPNFETDLTIDKQGHIKGKAVLNCLALTGGVQAVAFELSNLIQIDGVQDDAGAACYFVDEQARDKIGEPPLRQRRPVVVFPSALAAGESRKLTVTYHSDDLIKKLPETKFYLIRSTEGWYPSYGYLNRSVSRCTYRYPPELQLLAVGTKEKEWDEGGLKCSTWAQTVPVAFTSFNIGEFKREQIKVEGLPTADVYMGKEHTGFRIGGDANQNVAADIMNSLNFFQQLFGPYPFPAIVASEIPASMGQGFPGFLYLGWFTFQDEALQEFEESFRAHEVSHQWWGHVVGWDTYHDQWLSEGFAEYSGAMFASGTESGRKKDMMRRMTKNWRDDIIERGGFAFSRYGRSDYVGGKIPSRLSAGNEAGPIWLGTRLACSKGPIDYQILVYEKGAYVLHMLRMMMRDMKTGSDDKFFAMMKEFTAAHSGKNATTNDFRRVAEKYMSMDLKWFFDQWVYGTAIPKYTFKHRMEKGEGGKDQLVCDVEQSDVPDGFKMPVPVKLDFGGGKAAFFRLPVTKASETFRMNVPAAPTDVEFNFWNGVLCRVD